MYLSFTVEGRKFLQPIPAENKNAKNDIAAFFVTFLSLALGYRLWFFTAAFDPNGNIMTLYHYANVLLGIADDMFVVACFTLLFIAAHKIQPFSFLSVKTFNYIVTFATCVLLFFSAILFLINQKTISLLSIGFSYRMLMSAYQQGFRLPDSVAFISVIDLIFVLSPIILFLILQRVATNKMISFIVYFFLPLLGFVITCALLCFTMLNLIPREHDDKFFYNPVTFFSFDVLHTFTNHYSQRIDVPLLPAQMHSVRLISPEFLQQKNQQPSFLPASESQKKWNIVIIILESVGMPYLDNKHYLKKNPMPFLHALSKKSLWFTNQYSSGNNSPLGVFSLVTGIYPDFAPLHFALRSDMRIPTIASFLDQSYEKFFVLAGDSRSYFPKALLQYSGYKIYDAQNIPLTHKVFRSNVYLDERQSHAFFLSLLDQTKPPFFGIYYTAATHFPYFDYPDFHLSDKINYSIIRYFNNLYLLDYEIKSIFEKLRVKKLLDSTIFIVIGDHGEGFGQHQEEGGYIHGDGLFQEQIKIPALIYQPKLFPAHENSQLTSIVDIVPTILSAMNIPYDSNQFQGESLLQKNLARKYIFIYNDAGDEIATINAMNQKMQISFSTGRCRAFDLNIDPKELTILPCVNYEQETAIIKFRHYQSNMLGWYNAKLKKVAN